MVSLIERPSVENGFEKGFMFSDAIRYLGPFSILAVERKISSYGQRPKFCSSRVFNSED